MFLSREIEKRDSAVLSHRASICETGVFFTELFKKFSQAKYEEGWKQEYLARKQESDEDTDKMRLWIQASGAW